MERDFIDTYIDIMEETKRVPAKMQDVIAFLSVDWTYGVDR